MYTVLNVYEDSGPKKTYKQISVTIKELETKAKKIYRENPTSRDWENEEVDIRSLMNHPTEEYLTFQMEAQTQIEELLSKKNILDEEKLLKIFKIRQEILETQLKKITIHRMGLVANLLREIKNELRRDIIKTYKDEYDYNEGFKVTSNSQSEFSEKLESRDKRNRKIDRETLYRNIIIQ